MDSPDSKRPVDPWKSLAERNNVLNSKPEPRATTDAMLDAAEEAIFGAIRQYPVIYTADDQAVALFQAVVHGLRVLSAVVPEVRIDFAGLDRLNDELIAESMKEVDGGIEGDAGGEAMTIDAHVGDTAQNAGLAAIATAAGMAGYPKTAMAASVAYKSYSEISRSKTGAYKLYLGASTIALGGVAAYNTWLGPFHDQLLKIAANQAAAEVEPLKFSGGFLERLGQGAKWAQRRIGLDPYGEVVKKTEFKSRWHLTDEQFENAATVYTNLNYGTEAQLALTLLRGVNMAVDAGKVMATYVVAPSAVVTVGLVAGGWLAVGAVVNAREKRARRDIDKAEETANEMTDLRAVTSKRHTAKHLENYDWTPFDDKKETLERRANEITENAEISWGEALEFLKWYEDGIGEMEKMFDNMQALYNTPGERADREKAERLLKNKYDRVVYDGLFNKLNNLLKKYEKTTKFKRQQLDKKYKNALAWIKAMEFEVASEKKRREYPDEETMKQRIEQNERYISEINRLIQKSKPPYPGRPRPVTVDAPIGVDEMIDARLAARENRRYGAPVGVGVEELCAARLVELIAL